MEQRVLCPGCMKVKSGRPICEFCGHDERMPNGAHQLPVGTVLKGQYAIGKVLGQGGFGITYLGWDQNLRLPVAIKEYYPTGTVSRESRYSLQVTNCEGVNGGIFNQNLQRFIREAQSLARLRSLPEVVGVLNFFTENGTAYIIMEYLQGQTLKDYLKQYGILSARQAMEIFRPIMLALDKVHQEGLVHRDISPDNIMLMPGGGVKILDFGAVRDVAVKGLQQSTQAILKPGFAPPEQYRSHSILGPETDVYALCATIYYSMTGRLLPDAMERMMEHNPVDWSGAQGLSSHQQQVLNQGLALMKADRVGSMKQLEQMLFASESAAQVQILAASAEKKPPVAGVQEIPAQNIPQFTAPIQQSVTAPVQQSVTAPAQEKPEMYTAPVSRQPVVAPENNRGRSDSRGRPRWLKLAVAAIVAIVVVVLSVIWAGGRQEEPEDFTVDTPTETTVPVETVPEPVEISLWTFPIGAWGDEKMVSSLLTDFHKAYPHITVTVEYLNYIDGFDKIETAIAYGMPPDIVMEGPESLVTNWGRNGYMVDLSDCVPAGTYGTVVDICTATTGEVYQVPVCMTTHCMAINRDVFEAAGALRYLDEETHTWNSVDDFFKAVQAVYDYGIDCVGIVYCAGQGGDFGTRSIVTELGGDRFTDAGNSVYTYATERNAQALSRLVNQKGIVFDSSIVGGDALNLFANQDAAMTFCWNQAQGRSYEGKIDFEVLPMAFPTDTSPNLEGGVWGFGVFENEEKSRVEAAKTFIRFMTQEDSQYIRSVEATGFAPARKLDGVYEHDALFSEYMDFYTMLGDYYQVTPNWSLARFEWWNMLQRVVGTNGSTAAILTEMTTAQNRSNAPT